MTNSDRETQLDQEETFSSWRSFGAVAAGLLAQTEAQRNSLDQLDRTRFVPIAWAAE